MPAFGPLYKNVLETGSQDTGGDAEAMVKASMVRRYRRILDMSTHNQALREFSLTTNTTQSQYGLPLYVDTILNIEDGANDWDLTEMTHSEYKAILPGNSDTGTPEWYYPFGNFGVQVQPSSTGVLKFVSDSTSDTTTTYVTATGYNANNIWIQETVTMTGTTSVSTVKSFVTVERIVKSQNDGANWVGNLTVSDTSDNVLARIPVDVESPTYRWVEFYFKPSAALTYTIAANAFKPSLADDTDWPEFDEDYHDLLVIGAQIDTFAVFGKGDQLDGLKVEWRIRMKEYKSYIDPSPNLIQYMTDVSMGEQLPNRPWVAGVHRGLASAQ
jgi:hypothetical protein